MRAVCAVVLCVGCAGDSTTAVVDVDASEADAPETEVTPEPWWQGAVVYEVFVRSFQDSDGDGIGDLQGVADRLDYLEDLGVDALWLMPIHPSPSYHGYDVTDYASVNPDYGSDADFDALVAAARARGIHVVLDFVMNHSSDQHPWFRDALTPTSAHRDFYLWRADDPGWTQPFGDAHVWHARGGAFFYGLFWSGMPDLDYRNAAVRHAMTGLAAGWLDRGVAGFRLDAARYLVESESGALAEQPETHAFWQELRAALEAEHDVYLVGEAWTARDAVASYYGEGNELHQAFAFDLASAIEDALTHDAASWLVSAIAARRRAGSPPWSFDATFLSNHDLDRLAQRLDDAELRAAAVLLFTLPGTPYLYYGDELGARSAPGQGDLAKRGPMAWTADAGHGFTSATPWLGFAAESDTRNVEVERADPTSVFAQNRSLIALRRNAAALRGPEVEVVASESPALFAMLRDAGSSTLLVILSLAAEPLTVDALDLSAASARLGVPRADITRVFGGGDDVHALTSWSAFPVGTLAPGEARIYRLR